MSNNRDAFQFALDRGVFTDNAGDYNYQGNYRYAGTVRLFDGEKAHNCYVFQHVINPRKIVRLQREQEAA